MRVDNHAILLGSMKSGTSTLYSLLAQHPQVEGALIKEPVYYCKTKRNGPCPVEKYGDVWPNATLDGSTSYTKYPTFPGVPEAIRADGLEPRFIYIMRDPIRRIESHWDHLRLDPNFDLSSGLLDNMIAPSRYHEQLSRFRAQFPERERYLLLLFEELRERKCFEFLDIDPGFEPEIANANVTKPYSNLELRFERLGVGKAVRRLPDWIKDAVRSLLDKSGSAPKMTLDEAKKAEIRAMLADDMHALERDYAIDVSQWGFGERAVEPAKAGS